MQKVTSRVGLFASLLAAASLLHGCGVERIHDGPTSVAQESDPARGIICTNVPVPGSAVREKRCTTPEQREAERRVAERVLAPADYTGRRRTGM